MILAQTCTEPQLLVLRNHVQKERVQDVSQLVDAQVERVPDAGDV